MQPIAIYHEHPDWFKPLFAELERREVPFVKLDASAHLFDPSEDDVPYGLVVNRASPSAYLRGHAQSTFYTLHWLRHLERIGIPVVNGSSIYSFELSKATQLDLLEGLGLPYPKSRAINHVSLAIEAAKALRYPVLVKANIGGSGAGIVRYDSESALAGAVARGEVELGIDGVALVQESAPLRDGHIVRVETLDGNFLYGIKVFPAVGSFDLCPADACQTANGVEASCAAPARSTRPRQGFVSKALRRRRESLRRWRLFLDGLASTLGALSTSSTIATATTISTTLMRCRTSSRIRSMLSASTRGRSSSTISKAVSAVTM